MSLEICYSTNSGHLDFESAVTPKSDEIKAKFS